MKKLDGMKDKANNMNLQVTGGKNRRIVFQEQQVYFKIITEAIIEGDVATRNVSLKRVTLGGESVWDGVEEREREMERNSERKKRKRETEEKQKEVEKDEDNL